MTTMAAMYADGATLAEVGAAFGVSRERVRQLFRQYGLLTRSVGQAAALKQDSYRERAPAVVEAFMRLRDERLVAEHLSLPLKAVAEIVRELVPVRERRRVTTWPQKYSDDELLACLRQASTELGGVLTASGFTELARRQRFPDGRRWPTHQTHCKRFGSWRGALKTAGLSSNPESAIAGKRLFEREHCIDAVRAATRELGDVPTASAYERYARSTRGALPSLATVRDRCGGWSDALRLAGV